MSISRRLFKTRNFAALLLILMIAAVAYAFAATNTVDGGAAGQGEGTISGFSITQTRYTFDKSTSPPSIDYVAFDIDPDVTAGEVEARVYDSGGTEDTGYVTCTDVRPGGLSGAWTREWYCQVSTGGTVHVNNADTLDVLATQ